MSRSAKLIKNSRKSLEQLSGSDVRQMIRDSLARNYQNYDEAALDEFLNVDCVDEESEALRLRMLEIEKRLFDSGDRFGLSSEAARAALGAISSEATR